MGQALWSGLAVGAAYTLMALGFALELELCDIVNAAHGAFVVLGMYLTLELLNGGVPVLAAVVAATAAVAAVAVPSYVFFVGPARATPGHRIQLIYTLLILIASPAVFQLLFGGDILAVNHRFAQVALPGGALSTIELATIALAVVLGVGLSLASRLTTIGKLVYAAGRYAQGARAIGVPIPRVYAAVFILGSGLAGFAGALIVPFQPVSPALGVELVSVVFLVALVANTSLLGCLVLGLVYGVAQALLNYYAPAAVSASLAYAVFLVALVLVRQRASRFRVAA
jgi:branched-chain amino acid transport system permease protein